MSEHKHEVICITHSGNVIITLPILVFLPVLFVVSLVPRPRPAFRRLQYGKAVEGLEYFIT